MSTRPRRMEEEEDVATVVDGGCGDGDGELWLPAELWAMVCQSLSTADLARLSSTCWTLRSHALSRVRHHKAFCNGASLSLSLLSLACPGPVQVFLFSSFFSPSCSYPLLNLR